MDENVDLFHFLIVLQNKLFVICTPEGWVTPPKRMKFLKSAKGGWDGMGWDGIYCVATALTKDCLFSIQKLDCRFRTLKQGFLSMKL